jgi:hypothetical protein
MQAASLTAQPLIPSFDPEPSLPARMHIEHKLLLCAPHHRRRRVPWPTAPWPQAGLTLGFAAPQPLTRRPARGAEPPADGARVPMRAVRRDHLRRTT